MKNTTIIISLFIANMAFCQNDFKNKNSFSIVPNYPIAVGDNFLNKAYSDNLGVVFEYQYNFETVFVGLSYEIGNEKVSNKRLMGNLKSSDSYSVIYIIGYRQKLDNKKRYLEHKIGYGTKTIKNLTNINPYLIEGNSYVLSSKFNYIINEKIHLNTGLEYRYTCYQVIIDEPYKDFYNTSKQIIPSVGLRILF